MGAAARKAVLEHRKRLKERGLARIELRVRKEDAPLLRDIVAALADPARAVAVRRLLRQHFAAPANSDFKELLAAAPLDLELDFDRMVDPDRDIPF